MSLYLVDITRTISRIGRGFATGIDRVEIAYIRHCIAMDKANLFIARIGRHYAIIDNQTAAEVLKKSLNTHDWGRPNLADAVRFKLNWEQRCARSFLKRHALAKELTWDISKLLSSFGLDNFEYFNVGHSNLSDGFLSALKQHNCKKIHVLIHDMIPLDHPEYSQSHIPKAFEKRMRAVARYADRIICNSDVTRMRVVHYFDKWGAGPEFLTSHLGIEPMLLPTHTGYFVDRPYYVILGTIEPRKNHLLLFQLWQKMAATMAEDDLPYLYVVGRRGWDNIEAFQFLDESPLIGKVIFEKPNLDDAQMAKILLNAKALLFPSFVEGFGLPALEAAQLNVPVYCSDLDIFKEILGDLAVYLDPNSLNAWQVLIAQDLLDPPPDHENGISPPNRVIIPTWESHFRHVFG